MTVYSPSIILQGPHTKAAEMQDQLTDEIKTGRLNEILGIQDEITMRKNKVVGGTFQEILIEGRAKLMKENLQAGQDRIK